MRAATFTTYINAQTDPGMEAAFDRQARAATASYGVITAAAEKATRATAGLLGARGTAGISNAATRAVTDRTVATRNYTQAAAAAERQTANLAAATRRESQEAAAAARNNNNLTKSLNTTATSLAVVEGRMSPIAGRLLTIARASEQLSGLQLGIAGVGAVLFALGRAGNEYANISSKIRPFFENQQDANRALNDVVGIAARSRASLQSVSEIYARLTGQADALGVSQSRIGRATEIASKAATLSGGTAQAREGALVQFSQALGGNFRGAGQEFASLAEGAPQLLSAIAKGFKAANGEIGVSVSELRKLGEQGKVTSVEVLDALDRSALGIESKFARIPKTLNTAGTEFSNALTVMVGRFDQSVGFTSTLAGLLSGIANNLRAITGLAVGVGAAFAGIKLVSMVQGVAAAARQTLVMRSAIEQLGVRRRQIAAESLAQHQREIAALEAEAAQIRANIALQTRQRTVAARDVLRNQPDPASGFAGSSRRVAAAAAEERKAVRNLIQERQRLGIITGALTGANGRAAVAQARLDVATANTAKRVGLLRGGLSSLVGFLGGPWGIAFAAAATAVYLLATAESKAERATRLHEDAQRSFALIIESNTGKIYDQVDALQRLEVQRKSTADIGAAVGQAGAGRDQVISLLRNFTSPVDKGAYARAAALSANPVTGQVEGVNIDDYRRPATSGPQAELGKFVEAFARGERGSFPRLASAIERLGPKIDGLRERQPQIEQAASQFRDNVGTIRQGRARNRILEANRTGAKVNPRDLALANGEEVRTTNGPAKPRTAAQIAAEAQSRAAQTELQRARADLAKARAEGKGASETEDAYIDRLSAGIERVRTAEEAEKSLRKSRSAGAAQAKKEARDAVQDAKDAAAAKRDASLLDLEKRKPGLGQSAFLAERIAILKTYDDEVNKLDASAAASSRTAGQLIADARAVAAAAASAGEKRKDILAGYDDAPKAIDRALDQIDDLQRFVDTAVDGVAFIGKTKDEIAEIAKTNPLGTGIYTQEIADADARRIEQGVRKPLADIQRDQERSVEISRLVLQGREAEANALQRAYELIDGGIRLSAGEFEQLVRNNEQEERRNDLLASRQRVVSLLQGSVDDARDTVEGLLTDLGGGKVGDAFKSALSNVQKRFAQINARSLTEKLFAGTDAKVRALLTGKADVDGALGQYVETLGRTETAQEKLASATERAAERIDAATSGIGAGASLGGTSVGSSPANVGAQIANTFAGGSSAAAAVAGIAASAAGKAIGSNGGGQPAAAGDDIVVVARAVTKAVAPLESKRTPSPKELYNTIGAGFGSNIDNALHKVFGSGKKLADGTYDTSKGGFAGLGNTTFFKKIGDSFGTALAGAGQGEFASGIAKAVGIKQSKTGAQVGGAIGGLTGIPGGGFIGGLIGGTIGGLFKKTQKSSSTISFNAAGELAAGTATGSSKATRAAATGLAGGVVTGLNEIAEALGGSISGAGGVSIGTRKKKFVVDTTGSGRTKGSGTLSFDTEEEAVQAAIRNAIQDGVIGGISAASAKILQSGQDLQKAIEKAAVIESIPKRLMQLTDPVGFAVTTLNDEFSKMIAYLKEGGATAEQFADAQKLYDLERANAIEQATQQASSAIDAFLKDMVGSSSSPLNRKTVYENASSELDRFKSDIAGGKPVDQSALLTAARNFQDASKAYNGSNQAFFADFEALRSLLSTARDNAGSNTPNVTNLPASPFASDTSVQSAIASLQSGSTRATQDQTTVLGAKLDDLLEAVSSLGYTSAAAGGGSLRYLPGFGSA